MSYVICHHWEVTDALTLHWLCIVNASSGVLMSSPRYIILVIIIRFVLVIIGRSQMH